MNQWHSSRPNNDKLIYISLTISLYHGMQRNQAQRWLFPNRVFWFEGEIKQMKEGFKTKDTDNKKVSVRESIRRNKVFISLESKVNHSY